MKRKKPYRISSQEELDKLLKEADGIMIEGFVQLNFGVRSSKTVTLNSNGDYGVFNHIDGSEEIIKHDDLMKSFPIGEAISKGAFYID